jgi:hypothetical protein
MFLLDYENSEFTENSNFVLASATALVGGSIAILAAILM